MMKSSQTFLCALFLSVFIAHGQWAVIDTVPSGMYHSFHFLNADTGLVFNHTSNMRKTTDGGLTWSISSFPYWWSHVLDIDFYDDTTGYAAAYSQLGREGMILKTSDGGASWDSTSVTVSFGGFSALEVVGKNEFFTSYNGGVLYSADGGKTTSPILFPSPTLHEYSKRLSFCNPDTGYVLAEGVLQTVGPIFRLYRTYDKGINWQIIFSDTLSPADLFTNFVFTKTGKGVLVGIEGEIVRTIDNGLSWQRLPFPDTNLRFEVINVLNDTVYAGGYSFVWPTATPYFMFSPDWGTTWYNETNMSWEGGSTVDISFPAPHVAYMLSQGMLYKNRNFVSTESWPLSNFEIYPNPASDEISITLDKVTNIELRVYSMHGQIVINTDYKKVSDIQLDLIKLPKGVYTVELVGAVDRASKD